MGTADKRKQQKIAYRIDQLSRQATAAEEKLRRLYALVEDGITDRAVRRLATAYFNPSIDTLAVVISVGQSTSVSPVAVATRWPCGV